MSAHGTSTANPLARNAVNRGAATKFASGAAKEIRANTTHVTGAMGNDAARVKANASHAASKQAGTARENHAVNKGANTITPKVDAADKKNDRDSAL